MYYRKYSLEVDANHFDVLDREVVALINQDLNAGEPHSAIFNTSKLITDIYFCRLEKEKSVLVKKLILLK
jgi:hypothetical protein